MSTNDENPAVQHQSDAASAAPLAAEQAQQAAAFGAAWNTWHEARLRVVGAPHGLASLRFTHWLTDEATAYEGAPGIWKADDTGIVGEGLAGSGLTTLDGAEVLSDRVELLHGDELRFGEILLRGMERDGAFALRVLDPQTPGRVALQDIAAFSPDPAWVREARFVPSSGGTVETTSIDGHVSEDTPVGTVQLDLDGEQIAFDVTGGPSGLWAVIADGTSGAKDEHGTYRFRFLSMPAPAADGRVVVDFNRLYVPPCAFSDHYVCPLPAANNRFTTQIPVGERFPVLAS
ncbi:DUF1684 domain-containing protein [Plantibacter sp. Mn2098]|uniref:DUF1684 domain-containing protein n=1 Tax=Plantibacter sp. Mn2098 TaxID=3395266 RepID=UPI003BC96B3E